jgi:Fe-Mn family superoxide dismutase
VSDSLINRRAILTATTLAGVAVSTAGAGIAEAPRVAFEPKPLPFDPSGIQGLSEKLLVSHHDSYYLGAIKRLTAVENALATLDPATSPTYVLNGHKREELLACNAMILHEVYFASLGAPSKPSAQLARGLENDFGSVDNWAAQFSAMGKALSGAGWVVLAYNHRNSRLVNQWSGDLSMALVGASPILALDMYEHSYAMDYGARASDYVDAYMKVINWPSADVGYASALGMGPLAAYGRYDAPVGVKASVSF